MRRQMEELNRIFPNGDLQKRLQEQMEEARKQLKELEELDKDRETLR